MRVEARAIRRGLSRHAAIRPRWCARATARRRAADRAGELKAMSFGQLVVMGVGGGLRPTLQPGRPGRRTEVGVATCLSAPLLAGELRRVGLPVRAGRIATVDHLVGRCRTGRAGRRRRARWPTWSRRRWRPRPADRPLAVIRVVVDTAVAPGGSRHRPGGLAALRSLRAGRPVAGRWAAACAPRQVLLAGPRSFCAGVERAIEIVERALRTLRRAGLRAPADRAQRPRGGATSSDRGAVFVDELDEVPDGATVVFSAHGVAPAGARRRRPGAG